MLSKNLSFTHSTMYGSGLCFCELCLLNTEKYSLYLCSLEKSKKSQSCLVSLTLWIVSREYQLFLILNISSYLSLDFNIFLTSFMVAWVPLTSPLKFIHKLYLDNKKKIDNLLLSANKNDYQLHTNRTLLYYCSDPPSPTVNSLQNPVNYFISNIQSLSLK